MLIQLPDLSGGRVVDIAAGGTFSAILTDAGAVYVCGYGALGLGKDTTSVPLFTPIESLENIVSIKASSDYLVALDGK
ncbi:hypothetical protein EV182_008581, partial [Spiromyces aspiralis]